MLIIIAVINIIIIINRIGLADGSLLDCCALMTEVTALKPRKTCQITRRNNPVFTLAALSTSNLAQDHVVHCLLSLSFSICREQVPRHAGTEQGRIPY
jgi:hypothetical protein